MTISKIWFQCGDRMACAPPKCGGTALFCAALGLDPAFGSTVFWLAQQVTEFYTPDEVVESRCRAIMGVRHPVSRFMSLWRDKCRFGDDNLPQLRGLSPDALMDLIESDPMGNGHWIPQVHYYRPGFDVVPYRFLCVHLGLRRLTVNQSVILQDDAPAPVERIEQHYAEDFELCSRS